MFDNSWLEYGTLVTKQSHTFDLAVDPRGNEYTTYRDDRGQLYYVDFDAGTWVKVSTELEAVLVFRTATESYFEETEDSRFLKDGSISDSDEGEKGDGAYAYVAQVSVDVHYAKDESGGWVKRPLREQPDIVASLDLDVDRDVVDFYSTPEQVRRPTTRGNEVDRNGADGASDSIDDETVVAERDALISQVAELEATIGNMRAKCEQYDAVQAESVSLREKMQLMQKCVDELNDGYELMKEDRKRSKGQENEDLRSMERLLEQRDRSIAQLTQERDDARRRVAQADTSQQTAQETERQLVQLRTELSKLKGQESKEMCALQEQVSAMDTMTTRVKTLTEEVMEGKAVRDGIVCDVQARQATLAEAALEANGSLTALKKSVLAQRAEMKGHYDKFALDVRGAMKEYGVIIADLQERCGTLNEARKKAHNALLNLRGNIRVLCRMRPLVVGDVLGEVSEETTRRDGEVKPELIRAIECMEKERHVCRSHIEGKGPARSYEFDAVFGEASKQEDVFQEVYPLIVSVLDGYNVLLMAYGQTASGKTHTMSGSPQMPGIQVLALDALFSLIEKGRREYVTEVSVAMIEIYNEMIVDLLVDKKAGNDGKVKVKRDASGNTVVDGLQRVTVTSGEEAMRHFEEGLQRRQIASTLMNTASSRSHAIFEIYVVNTNRLTGVRTNAKLVFVDLAGSERVSRTGASGSRLVEAAAINRSLSTLGFVIEAIRKRVDYVPFRNSKLTMVLKDALSGESKSAMIVCCSPSAADVDETDNTLRFGLRVRQVSTGPVKRRVEIVQPLGANSGGNPPAGLIKAGGGVLSTPTPPKNRSAAGSAVLPAVPR